MPHNRFCPERHTKSKMDVMSCSRLISLKSGEINVWLLGWSMRHRSSLSVSLLEDILDESFTCFVRGSDQRATGTVEKSQIKGSYSPLFEDIWCDVFLDFHVSFGWPHVLAKGHDVDVNLAEF